MTDTKVILFDLQIIEVVVEQQCNSPARRYPSDIRSRHEPSRPTVDLGPYEKKLGDSLQSVNIFGSNIKKY